MKGYSPHYLMFGHRPRLPVNFYFSTLRGTEGPRRHTSTKHVGEYVATVRDHLKTALQEAQTQSVAEAQRQKWYSNQKIGAIGLKPSNLVLVKAGCLLREAEDQGQMGGQASCGSTSDCDRCSLILSEGPVWKFTHPTLQPAPPHCIRSLCSLVCRCPPSMGWMSHPSHTYSQREWQQDNATRRQWFGNHPVSGWEDFPGVDKWEAMASPVDVSQSVYWRWVKIPSNV